MEFRQISIDLDIHKAIEHERKSLNETENDILRRLLGVSQSPGAPKKAATSDDPAWERRGLVLPNGTHWRMIYGGETYEGTIERGRFQSVEGSFKSPSGLAIAVARTAKGERTSLNGWRYVEVLSSKSNKWRKLQDLLDETNS